MTYWDAVQLNSSSVEAAYCRWEGHQAGWHDQVELGDRVAEALIKQNPR